MAGAGEAVDASRPAPDAADVPDHAMPLGGGHWRLWRTAVLRGAGFPARLVLTLASEGATAAADRYLVAVDDVRRCQAGALAAMARQPASADRDTSRRNGKLRRKLRRGIVPADATGEHERALRDALAARAAAYADLVSASDLDAAVIDERLHGLASDLRFQEALLWQDRVSAASALRRVRDRLGSAGQRRKAADFIAQHAQRYAVKNDSIGFFGPFMWASLADEPMSIDVHPGPALLAHREVNFEGWGIDALVEQLDRMPGIRRWTTPRLRTGVWRGPDGVYAPVRGKVPLAPLEEGVLRACDGQRTAMDIAGALGGTGEDAEREVFDVLERLVAMELVTWRLEVAPQLHPERALEACLNRIGDPALRADALASLHELTRARASVAAAAGKPDELGRRLEELDATFTRLTGRPASRNAGMTYGARRLVYEDCRRDCDVRVGRELVNRIGPPLSIALDAARWAAGELAAAARRQVRLALAEVRGDSSDPVDGAYFAGHLRGIGPQALGEVAAEVLRRYQDAWASLVQLDGRPRRRRYDVAEIAARAQQIFGAPVHGWSRATFFSPDLMVAADGIDALRRNDFHAILGELHTSNTLLSSAALSQHPDPAIVGTALARDTHGETHVVAQIPRESFLARANRFILPAFWRYEYADDLPNLPRCRSMPAAMFVAVDDGRTVMMHARDGSVEFDVLEIFSFHLINTVNDIIAQRFPPAPHVPRLTIGDLTIARETWYVTGTDMSFLDEPDPYLQFAAVRRWARDRGMPRQVFYKSPVERKPCYLDVDSAPFVRIFIKLMKQMPPDGQVPIVEMMPGVNETWLHDAAGERYTCEFRLTARHTVQARR